MVDPLLQHVDLMTRGRVPTARDFVCPACGGPAHARAGRSKLGVPGLLCLSAWCDGCRANVEADGAPEWPGWEAIRDMR